jgi:hypothetical protein
MWRFYYRELRPGKLSISAMSDLACTLGDHGKLSDAAAMQRDTLEKSRRILGEEHLDTIWAMSPLAIILRHQGKLSDAAAVQRDVLEKRQRILGEEHPDTIWTMNSLALTPRH